MFTVKLPAARRWPNRPGDPSAAMVSMDAEARWSSAVLIAWSRLPSALWTVPRETPAASATAVRVNWRGPSRRSVSALAANSVGDTDRSGFSAVPPF